MEPHQELLLEDTRDVVERLFYEWLTENDSGVDRLRLSQALTSMIMAYDSLRDVVLGGAEHFEGPDDYAGFTGGGSE